jgi:hypothetical protein
MVANQQLWCAAKAKGTRWKRKVLGDALERVWWSYEIMHKLMLREPRKCNLHQLSIKQQSSPCWRPAKKGVSATSHFSDIALAQPDLVQRFTNATTITTTENHNMTCQSAMAIM